MANNILNSLLGLFIIVQIVSADFSKFCVIDNYARSQPNSLQLEYCDYVIFNQIYVNEDAKIHNVNGFAGT